MTMGVSRWTARFRGELLTLGACLLLTGAHLGYRAVVRPSDPAPVLVSGLEVGASVSTAAVVGVSGVGPCRLVITFSPDCPFCKRAAEKEGATQREARYASTTWVTEGVRPSLQAFQDRLPAGASPVVDPALYEALEVRAVPGLYLLDAEGEVRWVGPYRGDESTELLDARCSGVEAASQVGSVG